MVYYYVIPKWFFSLDIGLKILFASITFLVSFFSYKVYKISEHREAKLFSLSFLLISLSYFSWSLLNFLILPSYKTAEEITRLIIERNTYLLLLGVFTHMALFLSGLITIVYTQFKIKNGKVYYMMLGLALLVLASSFNKVMTFHILSAFLLTFIIYNYIEEYSKRNNKKTLFVLIAFIFLFLSSIDFIFSLSYYQAYVIGHLFELIAYILILLSLISSIRK